MRPLYTHQPPASMGIHVTKYVFGGIVAYADCIHPTVGIGITGLNVLAFLAMYVVLDVPTGMRRSVALYVNSSNNTSKGWHL